MSRRTDPHFHRDIVADLGKAGMTVGILKQFVVARIPAYVSPANPTEDQLFNANIDTNGACWRRLRFWRRLTPTPAASGKKGH